MTIIDKNGKELKDGDFVDLHQTVNGQRYFVVMTVSPLDIRYAYNLKHTYEYDPNQLFEPCMYSNESEFEITGNVLESLEKK